MSIDRREFLKRTCSLLTLAGVGSIPFLQSCSKNGVSPFYVIAIDANTCIGCGECLPACIYNAINLPERSKYWINIDKCVECGKCKPFCEPDAITISLISYQINTDKCVGCGKCIEKCKTEGNCISYERDSYSVRNRCKPNSCNKQCKAACPEGAITINGDKAVIDMKKCTRCGKCVSVCPFEAINPAKVKMDAAKCNHCGKCYPVCEFEAIKKIYPTDYLPPKIDMQKCTSCGKCLDACLEFNAIEREIHLATVNTQKCTACEKCFDACRFDSFQRVRS